jgi:carboxymethylenebutenolidase
MTEQDLQIRTPDGVTDAVLFSPDPSIPLPAVLHIPDIGSIRDATRQMARRLSAEGYTVLLPNPFYRTSAPPVFAGATVMGSPERMQRVTELAAPLTPEAQERDHTAYIDFLTTHSAAIANAPIGTVGYCIGGGIALRAAATRPDQVAAVASFHGGNLYKPDNPASPHLVLPRVKATLYFGHADQDKTMTADDIKHFNQALEAWGGDYDSEIYDGAYHSWTAPDSPVFNQTAADRAFEKLVELFDSTLHD